MIAIQISQMLGIPVDQVRIVLSQLYSLVLCFILYKIKDVGVRKIYSLIFGTLLQLYVFRDCLYQYAFLLVQIAGIYFICLKFRKNCGFIVTLFSILLISGCHIHRMITAYGAWEIQISTLIMMTICKLSLFSYQYQDGGRILNGHLNEQQRKQALIQIPSFYDYFCFIQFLPTAVMGPSMDYVDYSSFINLENQYKSIPLTFKPVFKSLIKCLGCFIIYQFIYLPYFSIDFMNTNNYLNLDAFTMMVYSFVSVTLIRFKYYFAWKLNSCSIHACGISYSGSHLDSQLKNKDLFKKHSNVNIRIVQSTYHVRDKIAHWNISVQGWLRRSIYDRVKSSGQFITFMVSAFWHGFYGGYYIAFFLWFVLVYLSQLVFKISRNYPQIQKGFRKSGFIGKALLWLFVNVMFSHIGGYFVLLRLSTGLQIMKALNYIPILIIIVPTIVLHFSGLWKKKKSTVKLN